MHQGLAIGYNHAFAAIDVLVEKAAPLILKMMNEQRLVSLTFDNYQEVHFKKEQRKGRSASMLLGTNAAVRKCPVASKMIGFYHISGKINQADILSKDWGYSQVWDQLKTMLFWKGDTGIISDQDQVHPPSTERGVTKSKQDLIS